MFFAKALSTLTHPLEDPSVGGSRGTTMGPFSPAGAKCICASEAGAMSETLSS